MRSLEAQLPGPHVPEAIHCLDGHLSVRGWTSHWEAETLFGREGEGWEKGGRGKEKERMNQCIRINSDEVHLTFPPSPQVGLPLRTCVFQGGLGGSRCGVLVFTREA